MYKVDFTVAKAWSHPVAAQNHLARLQIKLGRTDYSATLASNCTSLIELIPKNHHITVTSSKNHQYSSKSQKSNGIERTRSNVH
jgi:hypothetical protein